jgi:hypothetical protein
MQTTERNVPGFLLELLTLPVLRTVPVLQVLLVPREVFLQTVNAHHALLLVLHVPGRHQMTALCALLEPTSLMVIASEPTVTVSAWGQMEWLPITTNLHATVRHLHKSSPVPADLRFSLWCQMHILYNSQF